MDRTIQSLPGPPDEPGWWWIAIPGRDPFLLFVEKDKDHPLSRLWQDSFRKWRLVEQGSNLKTEALLERLGSHPSLLWDLMSLLPHIALVGPWETVEGQVCRRTPLGEIVGYPTGRWLPVVKLPGGQPRLLRDEEMDCLNDAKQVVDDYLRRVGYLVFDG